MHPRLASFISSVGSPVVLFPAIISFLVIKESGWERARPALLVLLAVFALLSLFILFRKMSGKVSNLDVSDRSQRARNVYLPSLLLVALAVGYFYWTGQPFVKQSLYVGSLLLTCFAINRYKKISLHTVVATYLSGLVLSGYFWAGTSLFVFAALIAWSRVVLGRHTREEVMLGWVVGSLFGLVQNWII